MADGGLPQRIHKLPDSLVNKIAAGEVIERPASVVKELLENSLDAGATRINIDIRNGGSRLIRIEDNGHGIHADDLLLAVDRHTTSKLRDYADLWRIRTLGFRGEALSSIASVSRFTLTSKQSGEDHGWSVSISTRNTAPVIQPAAHLSGTTVEVMDLFYNTPARRRFLRSEKTEFIHIQDLVKRIALSRFDLSIRLTHNNRQIFHFSDDKQHPVQRVAAIMGRAFQEQSIYVNQQLNDMTVHGWLGLPDVARSQTDQQYFYLNGRLVKDKLINHAVRLAFQDRIYSGRHPVFLLYLDMDVAAADVNVHPTKQEVRFCDARTVHDFIFGSLHRVLNEQTQTEMLNDKRLSAGNYRVRETKTDYQYTGLNHAVSQSGKTTAASAISIGGRYILAEEANGTVLVDVHCARELIAYIKLRLNWSENRNHSRPVLVPLTCPVTVAEAELIDQYQCLLEKPGLVINRTAPAALLIRELPLALPGADAISLIRDVIAVLKQDSLPDEQITRLLTALSRHANDSATERLTSTEINSLFVDLYRIKEHATDEEFKTALRYLDMQALHDLLND